MPRTMTEDRGNFCNSGTARDSVTDLRIKWEAVRNVNKSWGWNLIGFRTLVLCAELGVTDSLEWTDDPIRSTLNYLLRIECRS